MDDIDLAKSLRGTLGGGTTSRRVTSPTTTTTIAGTATGDSADGVVSVRIDGQGTGTGDDGSTEIATTANVREGDRVMVNLVGAVVFSSIGYCFVKKKGKGKFAPRFIPRVLTEEDRVGSPETAEPKDMGAKI